MPKLTPEQRRLMAAETDDGPDPADPKLIGAVQSIADALNKPEEPEAPEPDYTAAIESISKTLAAKNEGIAGAIRSASNEISALRADVQALTDAVAGIRSVDVSGISQAIVGLQKTQQALMEAMICPKEIVFDNEGNPTGLRVKRMN